MTAEEVANRVDSELASCRRLDNLHGIDLENIGTFRVPPTRREFTDPSAKSTCRAWVVIDEAPDSQTRGYLVVLDEASGRFGLAVKRGPGQAGVFIGVYGTLVETLNAM
jgi:hypothetical protein